MIRCRIRPPKLTPLEEKYESMKEVAHRRGIDFDLSFDEWLPIWTRLDEAWKRSKTIKKLGQLND
jgi:hypothetical protein